jgi:AcrR family transcriptional regulator
VPSRGTPDGGEAEPSLRSQHVEATRRAVLAAARDSFGRKGYAHSSVDEIAAAARVTKGAVYHHFAGKRELFRAVYSEVEAEAQTRTAAAVEAHGAPIDQVVAGVLAYLDVAMDEEVQRITLIDGPTVLGLEPEGPAEQHPGHLAMRSFIASAIARGEIVDLDPGVLAHLVGGLALLGGLLIARAGDPDAARATLGQALEPMLRALAPSKGH